MKGFERAVIALTFSLLAGACAETADDADVPADSVAADVAPDNINAPSAQPVVVKLDEVDDSNISGEATATHSTTDVTVAIVLQEGGQTGTSYPAHIHTGTCAAGGPVAVELAPVTNLQSQKTVPVSALSADQPSFVQVHDPSGKAVACGDMPGHGDANRPAGTTTTTY